MIDMDAILSFNLEGIVILSKRDRGNLNKDNIIRLLRVKMKHGTTNLSRNSIRVVNIHNVCSRVTMFNRYRKSHMKDFIMCRRAGLNNGRSGYEMVAPTVSRNQLRLITLKINEWS